MGEGKCFRKVGGEIVYGLTYSAQLWRGLNSIQQHPPCRIAGHLPQKYVNLVIKFGYEEFFIVKKLISIALELIIHENVPPYQASLICTVL